MHTKTKDNGEKKPEKYRFNPKKLNSLEILIGVIVVILVPFFFSKFIKPAPDSSARTVPKTIADQVVADTIEQYEIAKSSGKSAVDICVQAGIVVGAQLQAQDSGGYSHWKNIQSADCSAAGVPPN
jgi:hypothetical protein